MKKIAEPAKKKQRLIFQISQISSLKKHELFFSLKLDVEVARTLILNIQKFIPYKLIYQINAVV